MMRSLFAYLSRKAQNFTPEVFLGLPPAERRDLMELWEEGSHDCRIIILDRIQTLCG